MGLSLSTPVDESWDKLSLPRRRSLGLTDPPEPDDCTVLRSRILSQTSPIRAEAKRKRGGLR